MIVADTDVLIDFLEGRSPAADRVVLEVDRGQLRTTVISRFELLAGAKSGPQQNLVGELLAALPALPLDELAADRAAEVRRRLEQDGVGIGMADSLIAGIVLVHDGILLTRNRRYFERVSGLTLGRLGPLGGFGVPANTAVGALIGKMPTFNLSPSTSPRFSGGPANTTSGLDGRSRTLRVDGSARSASAPEPGGLR
jgi:tRNA(fMet)-specific endonuclease VapC